MHSLENDNTIQKLFDILGDEKTGAQAKRGFLYQDWWCTKKIFTLWSEKSKKDFALGTEIKEDAVVIDSIESVKNIAFYQIKKRENKFWTIGDLTNKNQQDKSTLAKLYSRFIPFQQDNINVKLYFSSNTNLQIGQIKNKTTKDNINFDLELEDTDKNKVTQSIIDQLNLKENQSVDLSKIHFETNDLPIVSMDLHTYGMVHTMNYNRDFPINLKNSNAAVNLTTLYINKISSSTTYASNIEALLERCITREKFEKIIDSIESFSLHPENIINKGIKILYTERYSHRKLQKIEASKTAFLLDYANIQKDDTKKLLRVIKEFYQAYEKHLDTLSDLGEIVDYVSISIFNTNNTIFDIEYIQCVVIFYDISSTGGIKD